MKQWMTAFIIVLFAGCSTVVEETPTPPVYDEVRIEPRMDTVFLAENNETRQFALVGSTVNVSEKTIENKGIMTSAKYIVREVDTLLQAVDPAIGSWRSSDPSVATVSKGLVTGKGPGTASISVSIGNTVSLPVIVNVRAVHNAPGLSLDPPSIIFILQNSLTVSGMVQLGAHLRIMEPVAGIDISPVPYSSTGAFSSTVPGLKQGFSVITVRATNPNDSTKYSERTKSVYYYDPNTLGANAIVGNWLGTTLGRSFHFTISNSIIPTRYDINGTVEIDFSSAGLGLGTVKDITLTGFLDHNGSINVALSKQTQGFTISGTFKGHFESAGTGSGRYSAQAVKTGWPKISFNEAWTAVKQ